MGEPESLAVDEPLAAHLQRHAVDRLLMLSDGVFAISVTLAALEIHLPESAVTLSGLAGAVAAPLVAYLLSFLAAALFWLRHRDLFARLRRVDGVLTGLTLALLCLVALVPVAVSGVAHHHGGAAYFGFYAVVMMGSGLLNALAWVYGAARPGLMHDHVPAADRWLRGGEALLLPLLFVPALFVPVADLPRVLLWLALALAVVRRGVLPALARRIGG